MQGADLKAATILVVDDTESNIDVLLRILDGYDLIPATSGEQALALLKRETVDLILLDIVMPDMDGFEVCRRLKAEPATRDIPIVFITAREDEQSIEKAYKMGGYDYVTKPFKPCELQARVQTQLTLYQQYRKLSRQNHELALADQALHESEERYRLAMEAARDAVWDWDVSSGAVYYSPGWRQIVGRQEVQPEYSTWEERIHPDDKEGVLKSLRAHLEGQSDDWSGEYRLRKADGSWTWVMGRGRVVRRDGDGNPLRMVGTMTDIDERKQFEQRIEFMAFNDTLTGLPNRDLLMDRLRQAISMVGRADQLLAVCYLDLDGFKPVNDQYGHHVGDALLVALANRLTDGLRQGDTLARLGGDEFVILLNGLVGIFDGEGIIDRILKSISQTFEIEGHAIQVTGSIGVTFYPIDDADAETLLRHADQAMYQAKESGKSGYRLFAGSPGGRGR